jgi:cysteine-rich secretory family protein
MNSWARGCLVTFGIVSAAVGQVATHRSNAFGDPGVTSAVSSSTSPIEGILDHINHYRRLEHLDPLSENQSDSRAAANHARYIIENRLGPGDYIIDSGHVKSGLSRTTHDEAHGNPWYSVAGASVATRSNTFTAATIPSDTRPWIDQLMTSPLSALFVLDPTLTSLGYGDYCADGRCAAVIVYDNNQSQVQLAREFKLTAANAPYYSESFSGSGESARNYLKSPIQFPPPAGRFPLSSYDGGREFGDPLSACAAYSPPTGLPIVLSLGEGLNESAAVRLESFSLMDGAQQLESCGYDAFSYANQETEIQEAGRNLLRNILRWKLAAVVIPRAPLKPGHTYTISMAVASQEYKWSFKIEPDQGHD